MIHWCRSSHSVPHLLIIVSVKSSSHSFSGFTHYSDSLTVKSFLILPAHIRVVLSVKVFKYINNLKLFWIAVDQYHVEHEQ